MKQRAVVTGVRVMCSRTLSFRSAPDLDEWAVRQMEWSAVADILFAAQERGVAISPICLEWEPVTITRRALFAEARVRLSTHHLPAHLLEQ